MFPKARTLRMDADTTRGKDGYEKILRAFSRGEADVLIGTQMIVKGHDFPGVTLVGAVMADVSLFAGDYRAPERTYQILVQAAGRAGRGSRPRDSGDSDLPAGALQYPGGGGAGLRKLLPGRDPVPAADGISSGLRASGGARILRTGRTPGRSHGVYPKYLIRVRRDRRVQLIGPAPESITKIQDLYRQVLYVKGPDKKR